MLKFFNIFSQTPSLRINGDKRPASIFGSIIGLLTISGLIGGMSFILFNYFSRLDFTINYYTDNLAKPNIDLKNIKLGLQIIDALGKQIPDHKRLFKISAKFWDIYLPVPGENKPQTVKLIDIPTIKCNQYKNDTLHEQEFDKLSSMYNDMTCLDLPSLNNSLKGIYGNLGK